MKITKALTRFDRSRNRSDVRAVARLGFNEYDLPDLLNYCGAGSG